MSVETPAFAAMVRRMVRAHGRRCADADVEDLVELVQLHRAVDDAVAVAIAGLKERHSWQAIADALGMSRQAVWSRYRFVDVDNESRSALNGGSGCGSDAGHDVEAAS